MFSDWGDAEHGGGLRHTEDGNAHQSFLRWDKDLIVLEANIRILYKDTLGSILDPGKVIFGHFIDFGNFSIEIPIEAEKFYGQQKEGSYIKNKNCFENRRPNGTTWNHVEVEEIKFSE